MATRILIVKADNPTLFVEIYNPDPAEDDYNGSCSRCTWTVAQAYSFGGADLTGAIQEAAVHIDHQHKEV